MSGLVLTLVTMNLQAHMALWKVARSVRKVVRLGHPHLLAFQEIGGVHKWLLIRTALGRRYAGLRLRGDASATPVAWRRSRFHLRAKRAWPLSGETRVGKAGAGPSVLRAKAATVAVLWDRFQHVYVILVNVHLAPQPDLNEARGQLSEQQIEGLVALKHWADETYPGCVILMPGDFNIVDRQRLQPLVDAGMHIGRDVADHGRHALSRILSNVVHRGMHTIQDLSDHDALAGRF